LSPTSPSRAWQRKNQLLLHLLQEKAVKLHLLQKLLQKNKHFFK
jgi:hypothetical protein